MIMETKKHIIVMGGRQQGRSAMVALLEKAKEINLETIQMEDVHEEGAALVLDSCTSDYEKYLTQLKKNEKIILDMKTSKNAATFKRAHPKTGRNDPCPCGSGKKYKHCHMTKQERQYVVIS